MGRRYHYRYNYSRARQHISERAQLTQLFGGIDREIEQLFLNLDSRSRDILLRWYGQQFGPQAEKYARTTYPKWKSGAVRLSGQTAQRLLELIPPLLPLERRFELVRKLRRHHLACTDIRLHAEPENWEAVVRPAVDTLVERSRTRNLPANVIARARWLAEGDTQAMYRMLNAIEEEEALGRVHLLDSEFRRIQVLLAELQHTRSITHTISLPQGNIRVEIRRPRKRWGSFFTSLVHRRGPVSHDDLRNQLVQARQPGTSVSQPIQPGSILDQAMADLSAEDAAALRQRALNERLSLEVGQAEADARFFNSSRDMANTVHLVREMDRTMKSDYDLRSQFNTASGTTDVHVKKNNNLMIMVVAIVVLFVVIIAVAG
jgi:hypothetical protein